MSRSAGHEQAKPSWAQILRKTGSWRTVQMLLGHKDLRMTTRYVHLSQEHLQEAVRLLEGGSEEAGGYNTATEALRAEIVES